MEFLRNKLTVTEAAPGLSESFFADLLEPRPAYETLAAFKDWAASAQQHMLRAQTRKNCPLAWVGIFVDQVGVAIVLHFTHGVPLRSAQTAASTLTQFFEKEMQQRLWANLHPLDELDRRRVDRWQTPASLCPSDLKRKRVAVANESAEPPAKRTRAELLAALLDDTDDEEECLVSPLLCIQDAGSAPAQESRDSRDLLRDLPGLWEYRAKVEATIVVAESGARPTLTFVRCHFEARRLQLIVQSVRDTYRKFSMLAVVREAAALAKAGAIPSAIGPRSRKSEFVKRCAAALDVLDASAEKDITKLPSGDQNAIRRMLGGENEPYRGCFSNECLDKEPAWTTAKVCVRCSYCNTPMSFGRTWKTGREMLRGEFIRLHQSIQMSEARTRSESKEPIRVQRARNALKSWTSEPDAPG